MQDMFKSDLFPNATCALTVLEVQRLYETLINEKTDLGFAVLQKICEVEKISDANPPIELIFLQLEKPDLNEIIDLIISKTKHNNLSANRGSFGLNLYNFCLEVICFFLKSHFQGIYSQMNQTK